MKLSDYLQELRSYAAEELIQPELKHHRQAHDQKIREDQDLADGAVLKADVEPGVGEDSPKEGDLVLVHVSIRAEDDEDIVLHSTQAEHGGSGQPLAFILQKGARAPRSWEIALAGMHKGGRCVVKARPSYGYYHPTCKLPPPAGVDATQVLSFDLRLVSWMPAAQVRGVTGAEEVVKQVLEEANSWESARPPFDVTFHLTMRTLAHDGVLQSGKLLFTTQPSSPAGAGGEQAEQQPLTCTLGADQLPPGIELAISHMCKGERALFIIPSAQLQPGSAAGAPQLPVPPAKCQQLEVVLQVLSIVQVRDLTGGGEVTKRRLREGQGEFPIDAPLNDTTVRLHYRVRALRQGVAGPWLMDTRDSSPDAPVELDTGCGEAPEAVEMCAKLMVPGELASVTTTSHKFAYAGRSDAPAGVEGADAVQWEVELFSFDKEGHWQVMSMEDRFTMAEKVKSKANALVKAGSHAFALARYERLLRLMESTRDWETDEEVQRMNGYKLAVLLNLALCCIALNEPTQAINWCSKALDYDENNAKAYLRRGRAKSLQGNYEEAEEDLKRAAELDASWAADVEKELATNQKRAKAAAIKQKSQFKNFFDRTT